MSILASLTRAYTRLKDVPPPGYSIENIGLVVGLNEDGSVASVTPLFDQEGRKRKSRRMLVPQPVKKSSNIASNFLWEKTSYALGITAGEGKRTEREHAAFRERHERELAGTDDPGLQALLLFLQKWSPDQFAPPLWNDDYKDQNVVFALESERLGNVYLHDRPAAKTLWAKIKAPQDDNPQVCLVTGDRGPVARLHPSIKGVWGAQSSGASIVSFNLDAFTSYGHEQGDNAPVSEYAAFAYTTALNRMLSDPEHRIQVGDASTVFWADAEDAEAALLAEALFPALFDPSVTEASVRDDVSILLQRLQRGDQDIGDDLALRAGELGEKVQKGIRFYVLGLAPNAARLSIRFYYESDFGDLLKNYQRFVDDMRIEPPWYGGFPSLYRYLLETAVLRKKENVPPNLAGEWMRSILNGTLYPISLLSTVLLRIRADGEVNALRASMLKAVLTRNFKMEVPVALDPNERDKGYVLGRLFAVYEEMQRAALGDRVNATIKDKFYAAASSTPGRVFSILENGSTNHLTKIRKVNYGRFVNLQKLQEEIMDLLEPADEPFPAYFSAREQAMFGLGYHHQHSAFRPRKNTQTEASSGETSE